MGQIVCCNRLFVNWVRYRGRDGGESDCVGLQVCQFISRRYSGVYLSAKDLSAGSVNPFVLCSCRDSVALLSCRSVGRESGYSVALSRTNT